MGIFRRQKDLLSRQRTELELDHLYGSQAHRRSDTASTAGEAPAFDHVWRVGRWVITVAPEQKRSFRERLASKRGAYAIVLTVGWFAVIWYRLLPDLTVVYIGLAIALGDTTLWALTRVRVHVAGPDTPALVRREPAPVMPRRDPAQRPLIENPWFVFPVAAVFLFAWNGNHHVLLGLAVLGAVIPVSVERLVRRRRTPKSPPA